MAKDAIEVAPHVYKAVLDNDRVRVLEVTMKPGDKTEMHSHPPVVAYALNDGKYRFTHPGGGEPMEIEMKAGDSVYMDAVEHATENIGSAEGRVVLVELKK